MAKKSGRAKKDKKKNSEKKKGGPGQRSIWYLVLLGLVMIAWMVWRVEPNWGLEWALIGGAIAGLAWSIFIFGYYMSQRKGSQEDK